MKATMMVLAFTLICGLPTANAGHMAIEDSIYSLYYNSGHSKKSTRYRIKDDANALGATTDVYTTNYSPTFSHKVNTRQKHLVDTATLSSLTKKQTAMIWQTQAGSDETSDQCSNVAEQGTGSGGDDAGVSFSVCPDTGETAI